MAKDRYSLSLRLLDEFYEYCTAEQLNPTLQRFERWLSKSKEVRHVSQTIPRS